MAKKLIVGLGNPGEKYIHTRHNFGARVLTALLETLGEQAAQEMGVAWLLPSVNMNDSGWPVAAFVKNNPIAASSILLIHDELELPLGKLLFRAGGSARGHKGVRSIQEHLGTRDIPRLRLGIGRPERGHEVPDYVLQKFTSEEEPVVKQVVDEAVEWLKNYVSSQEPVSSAS